MIASLFVVAFTTVASPATTGLFELDGDATAGPAPGDDWSTLFPTNTSTTVFNESFATDLPAGDTTYFSISSKDINDVSTWSATGTSAPDKDEITHAYAATYDSGAGNASKTIYFGADRYANNGDSSIGFWFLQNNISIGANGAFVGHHKQNDTLVVSDFTNGGTIANITVYRWDGGASGHLTLVATGQDCRFSAASATTCARVNAVGVASPWSYTPKSGAPNVFPPESFFEGGLDLTALYGNVPCFTNFLTETRSSQETTATLKDFVLHAFNDCVIVPPLASFALLKTADADPINLGDTIGFNVTLVNGGPDPSFDTNLSDPLPPIAGGWTLDGVWTLPTLNVSSGCAITGTAPTQTLSCAFGSLGVFEGRALHVSGPTAAPGDCGLQSNTAFLTTNANASQSRQSTANVTVLCPSLGITKVADATPVSVGTTIGFTITVTNGGPGTAYGVTLTDPLPTGPGLNWTTSSAGCGIATNVLTCSFGDMASGANASVHISSPTTAASAGTYLNIATTNATNDPGGSANDTIIVLAPSLHVQKTAHAATVSAGDSIGFQIDVWNDGAGTATGVTISDTLPTGSGVSWSTSDAGCSITAGVLSCSFGDLATGGNAHVNVTSGTSFASCGAYPNTVTASSTNGPDATANATTTVLCPSLDVLKTADATPVNTGDSIGFTINVSNAGPGIARSVTLHDPLPTGSGVSWSTTTTGCSVTADVLDCTIGDMASGAFFVAHVTSGTTAASAGTYPNTATASATNQPNVTANATIVVLAPSLGITKTADATPVNAGDSIGFTINVSNAGPGTARSVTLHDPLPTGTGVSWSTTTAGCSVTSQVLDCTIGDMASGAFFVAHVTSGTTAASAGTYPNVAVASSTNNDPSNVTANDTIVVLAPGLGITKIADATPVNTGDSIGFTINVSNSGPGIARNVTLHDPLPTGSGVSWSTTTTGCSVTADVLDCTIGDMASGAFFVAHVMSGTTAASAGTYPNTATASASNSADVTANATIVVLAPSLGVSKTADAASVSAGSPIGFTITVSNGGPGTAYGVTLTDPLPSGGGISWSTSSSGCSVAAGALSCSFGDLANGSSANAHVSSGTTMASCQAYDNTATASATNGANVTGSASTTVLCPAMTIVKLADATSVSAGSSIGFGIWVNNTGNGTETSVTLHDPLPTGSGISWTIDTDTTGLCGIASNVLDCSYGDLAPGDGRYVHISSPTIAASCGEYDNTATAQNQETVNASASTTVLCPSLSINKTADAASVTAGAAIGFTIAVSNGGPGVATGVTMTDTLPTGSGVSWSTTTAGCSVSAGTLSCAFGDLAPNGSASVHVTSPTDPSSCATYPNTASANATNAPSVNASASTTVTCPVGNATRTLGFWATHTAYTESVFDANFSDTMTVGTATHLRTIDTYGKLFGAFYASIPYKTDGHKRSTVDAARMALLQQLVAAKLNCGAFGCNGTAQSWIAAADAAYAAGSKAQIGAYTTILDSFNQGGDGIAVPNTGSATPDQSQAIADRAFWDDT
jgi:uncharacterized repeat protein (TIGR01451 family)